MKWILFIFLGFIALFAAVVSHGNELEREDENICRHRIAPLMRNDYSALMDTCMDMRRQLRKWGEYRGRGAL